MKKVFDRGLRNIKTPRCFDIAIIKHYFECFAFIYRKYSFSNESVYLKRKFTSTMNSIHFYYQFNSLRLLQGKTLIHTWIVMNSWFIYFIINIFLKEHFICNKIVSNVKLIQKGKGTNHPTTIWEGRSSTWPSRRLNIIQRSHRLPRYNPCLSKIDFGVNICWRRIENRRTQLLPCSSTHLTSKSRESPILVHPIRA